VYRCTLDRNSI